MNPLATVPARAEHILRVSRPQITIAMILCGIVSAAGIGAAGAAVQEDGAPSIVVKYNPDNLLTDGGARVVYKKIVTAAVQVCPTRVDSFMPSEAVRQCRAQAIARAVLKINNPKLAAIHASASRNG
jgi:UrcA family protein